MSPSVDVCYMILQHLDNPVCCFWSYSSLLKANATLPSSKSRCTLDAFGRVNSAFRKAILPRFFKTLKVNLTSNGLERVLDEISPSTLSHCTKLDLLMTEVDFPEELQKLFIKLLNHLTKLQTVAIQIARADGTSVIAHLAATKAILRITSDLRPAADCALSLKTLDRTGFAMVLDDFGAFLQCSFSDVSVNGLTVISVLNGDRELLAASTTLSNLRSFEVHSSDVLPFYLTTMIQSKHLRSISMSRIRDPVSCAYIFNLRNVKETLVHASLLDMPFYRVVDNKVASSAPHTSTSPLPQTLVALESLRIGQREGPRYQSLALRPLFDAFRMPALKRLELVISGQQTWYLETVQDIMALLPSLKEVHVDDVWFENFAAQPDQAFRAGLLAFEAFYLNRGIVFTLSVTIKSPDVSCFLLRLQGLSDHLKLWSAFLIRIRFAYRGLALSYGVHETALVLPHLQELVFDLPPESGQTLGLAEWLGYLTVPALAALDVTLIEGFDGENTAANILKALPALNGLSRLSFRVPVGFDAYMHNLERTCASQGVDFSVRFQ